MFSIGAFASMGRVSVRMLRHYDKVGLLRPARVDEFSGYRYYEADQLRRLNRLLACKDLGFTLDEVKSILDEDDADLAGLLRRREAELVQQITADQDRLTRVRARLALIRAEGASPSEAVTIEPLRPARVALLRGVAASSDHEDVGPVIRLLFGELIKAMGTDSPAGPAIATYRPLDGGALEVQACFPIGPEAPSGVEIAELPGHPTAATYLHRGTMADIGLAYQVLAAWVEDAGHGTDGTAREVYLTSFPEPEENWRTAVQLPVT
ncbi:MerR family transcriptional regulator [Microlunatus parietis]|uniref:DNA-binding transcriptional MerR regulator n=1 Tax=Microlunatus parietis TaxID=682979 RepID=A0A7Y9I5Z3_9ACTN|nr:MerR family transcriptional regulator [Microlunatus parietis]NYE70339.1 DNA-binding transcriptional MerR regulator [Microlunatus parietis]